MWSCLWVNKTEAERLWTKSLKSKLFRLNWWRKSHSVDERILDISPKHQTKARRRYINTHTEKKAQNACICLISIHAQVHIHTPGFSLSAADGLCFTSRWPIYCTCIGSAGVRQLSQGRNGRQKGYCPCTWVKADRKGFRIMLRCQSSGRWFLSLSFKCVYGALRICQSSFSINQRAHRRNNRT